MDVFWMLLTVVGVFTVICSPLVWLLWWIVKRANRRDSEQRVNRAVDELMAQVERDAAKPPEPNRWTPEAFTRLRLVVRRQPVLLGNTVVCPLIPHRMAELLGIPEEKRDDVPGDVIHADILHEGAYAEFLDRLDGMDASKAESQKLFNQELVDGLIDAFEKIGKPERAAVVRSWAKAKKFAA